MGIWQLCGGGKKRKRISRTPLSGRVNMKHRFRGVRGTYRCAYYVLITAYGMACKLQHQLSAGFSVPFSFFLLSFPSPASFSKSKLLCMLHLQHTPAGTTLDPMGTAPTH